MKVRSLELLHIMYQTKEISFVLKFPSFCSPQKTVWRLAIELA